LASRTPRHPPQKGGLGGPQRVAGTAQAINTATVSPDITVDLSGTILDDQLVGDDDLAGTVIAVSLGSLPDASDVNAYYLESDSNDELFSLDVTADLGGLTAHRGDVVRYDGSIYTLEFDASAKGVPDGVVTDAVAIVGSDLLLSFDTTVALGGNTYDDEDLVRFDGSTFTLFFDGSANGVPRSLDLDAAHYFETDGILALSLDGSGAVSGVSFDDDDAIEMRIASGSWAMTYDGSAQHPGWPAGDLNAIHFVPEPGVGVMLASGAIFLLTVGRRRARVTSAPAQGRPRGE
jgi:hypothetical protein